MTANNVNKNITVFDVARQAGVSKSTVSLVLTESDKVSEKSKEKVLKAIDELGYVYNRDAAALRSRRSNLVGVVINDLTNPYSAQLAVGLERHIRSLGYMSVLVNSGEDLTTQKQLVQQLKEYRLAALVICPTPGTDAQWLNQQIDAGIPVIQIMREVVGARAPLVIPDNVKGTSLVTQHLLDQGYRHLAFIGGNESISDFHERLAGFDRTLLKAQLTNLQITRIQAPTNRHGGRQAIQQALQSDPNLQAIVCFNDVIAYGAIEQLHALGRIPGKDIAVAGFDDLEDSCRMSPALTTVHIDADKIGQAVCRLLGNKKEAVASEGRILVDVEFIPRSSG
ncbi:LacI family DNA-binding transcriptional regulator [Bowmanella denitrificans]|uniref:LacI family DNA-binding transcriptional regulator n=1 Tax=Bowmanella denitrificans TaxID=366582 RepID=UPI000C999B3B|nr:LacI family DNA-binding transcriptional regulator [Bowmanella denitrificans]